MRKKQPLELFDAHRLQSEQSLHYRKKEKRTQCAEDSRSRVGHHFQSLNQPSLSANKKSGATRHRERQQRVVQRIASTDFSYAAPLRSRAARNVFNRVRVNQIWVGCEARTCLRKAYCGGQWVPQIGREVTKEAEAEASKKKKKKKKKSVERKRQR
jgi:hypothetical protein